MRSGLISVVIPVRAGGNAAVTLDSLEAQSDRNFEIIVQHDREQRGASWVRNEGFKQASGEFVLFSDDDIRWEPFALDVLRKTLTDNPNASYAYGAYQWGDHVNSTEQFDADLLRKRNFVSTMALVRTADHPGWDELLKQLEDWDVYLTLLDQGKIGVHCGFRVFSTDINRSGVTYGSLDTLAAAERCVKEKHGIWRARS